ncbi:hypothetical protein [Nocardia sp. NPDC050175]|uniref:hypothetical protein n=1 Tax=Nocardia sp. NPDC050175 TaxID=3364317 RepID=UPI0037A54EDD
MSELMHQCENYWVTRNMSDRTSMEMARGGVRLVGDGAIGARYDKCRAAVMVTLGGTGSGCQGLWSGLYLRPEDLPGVIAVLEAAYRDALIANGAGLPPIPYVDITLRARENSEVA